MVENWLANSKKKAQVTIFVIVAILVVVGIVLFFLVRGQFGLGGVPAEFQPIYNLYSACIEQEVQSGLEILGTQGGKIDTDVYIPGSDFAPFSNQLNFLGIGIPYWYYVSGNNLISEQVPSLTDMEEELASYVATGLEDCDFTSFYQQGFYIEFPTGDEIEVDVNINSGSVDVSVSSTVVSSIEDRTARKTSHDIQVNSKIGEFYEVARDIYDSEKEDAFLEEYAVDTLRLNAPVDGVTASCAPEIWETREVVDSLQEALQANIASIKFNGDYYEFDDADDDYFLVESVNVPRGASVNLLYNPSWPNKVEITPGSNEILLAEPIGNQQGLGVLGFCYVPYHFVYDLSFPVLIQVSDGIEIFQFPVAVIIDNNMPREAELLATPIQEESDFDICEFAETDVVVNTFDNNLNGVQAEVEYVCFDRRCDLGQTDEEGVLNAKVPSCLNGQIVSKADGFANSEVLFSSNTETSANVLMQREYLVNVDLELGNVISNDASAIVHFRSAHDVQTAVFPSKNEVTLSEGEYEIEAFVYGASDVTIPATTKTECFDAPQGGIGGLFGGTKEECIKIDIPEVSVDNALVGGGTLSTFLLETELNKGNVVVSVSKLPDVNSLEQLQTNYELLEDSRLGVVFV